MVQPVVFRSNIWKQFPCKHAGSRLKLYWEKDWWSIQFKSSICILFIFIAGDVISEVHHWSLWNLNSETVDIKILAFHWFIKWLSCHPNWDLYTCRGYCINSLRPRQNGRHFADDTFKRFFQNENVWITIKISLKFVPKAPINNVSSLVQIMTWRHPGDKPLSEPMMVSLPTHICVTRPQWV